MKANKEKMASFMSMLLTSIMHEDKDIARSLVEECPLAIESGDLHPTLTETPTGPVVKFTMSRVIFPEGAEKGLGGHPGIGVEEFTLTLTQKFVPYDDE